MVEFVVGNKYTRADVKERVGESRHSMFGEWIKGAVERNGEFFLFPNVGVPGTTGHSYPNRWEGNLLRWYHEKRSKRSWPKVKRLLEPERVVHVFWRDATNSPFEYAGKGRAECSSDTSPVEILWAFDQPDPPRFIKRDGLVA